jgi:probable phosphoglycerate mutase
MTHTANFDGACEPTNPGGWGGWGFVIHTPTGEELLARGGLLPRGPAMTNNVAEYTAALECVRAWIELRGDSKLVVEQMCGRWQVKQGAYVAVHRELRALLGAHTVAVTWTWIPRTQNARADELSKQELVKAGVKIVH